MLKSLIIKNYALIDELAVNFDKELSIITGETGAGKSILLGGLGLILGNRADLSSINNKDTKCVIEAEFDIGNYQLEQLFEAEDLDYETVTIIRREILPSGKSRAFINDSPVALSSLKLVGNQLIDIHSQHQTLQLTDDNFQFDVIDALAGNEVKVVDYKATLKELHGLKKELEEFLRLQQESQNNEDYNKFLLEELLEVKLDEIDLTSLEEEYEQLSNVEHIQQVLLKANQILSDEQLGALNTLIDLKNTVKEIADFSSQYESLRERINSAHIELEDVFSEIESEQEAVEANPERLEEINRVLGVLNNLFQKHQVATVAELLKIQSDLDQKVGAVADLAGQISSKKEAIVKTETNLNKLAEELHKARVNAIPKLKKQLEKILSNLGMENAQFAITVDLKEQFFANGKDELSFLFSANKGGNFNELKKAASGGELSRIMLAIKAILSKYKQLPSIMFDEIDTGVSGDIATKMGLLMEYMSQSMQVFTITHLPQIASKGKAHFKVFKEDIDEITKTNIKKLSDQDRVHEIAVMLGGKEITETAISHAKELLN